MQQSGPIHLVQLTDTHLYSDAAATLHGVNTAISFARVLDAVAQRNRQPAAVLATGDLSQDGSRASYERFRSLLDALNSPVLCLPGNHDNPAAMREVLDAGRYRYCQTEWFGGWCLPMLNTFSAGRAGGHLSPQSLKDLGQLLAECSGYHVLICLHHHPVAMNSRWLDSVGLDNGDDFLKLIAEAPHVRGVVWGHVHQEFDETRDGVRFLASPSTCFQFLPRADEFALDSLPAGYRFIDLEADGSIQTEVTWLDDGREYTDE